MIKKINDPMMNVLRHSFTITVNSIIFVIAGFAVFKNNNVKKISNITS